MTLKLLKESGYIFKKVLFDLKLNIISRKLGKNVFDPINAEATVFVPVPESITTYDFSAVSMNECYGLGMSEKVTSLKIFQDFFILLTLPHHCKRTEVVYIDIGVFSYLDRNQSVTISVTRNDKEFTVLKPEFDGWTSNF